MQSSRLPGRSDNGAEPWSNASFYQADGGRDCIAISEHRGAPGGLEWGCGQGAGHAPESESLNLCLQCLICSTLIQALAESMEVMRIKEDRDLREDRFNRA